MSTWKANVARIAGSIALIVLAPTTIAAEVGTVSAQAPPYRLSDYAAFAGPGTVDVTARLVATLGPFGRRGWGRVSITAVPRTPYNAWFISRTAYCMRAASKCDFKSFNYPAELQQFNAVTKSDANGYFTFHHLHAGTYYFHGMIEAMYLSQHVVDGTKIVVTPEGDPVPVQDAHLEGDGANYTFAVVTTATVSATAPVVPDFQIMSQNVVS